MKKVLIFTNVVFLTTAIFFACNPTDNPGTGDVPVTAKCDHCKDYSHETFEGIPAGLAFTMISKYKANHWNNYHVVTSNDPKPTDARSVWFSLDEMKKFIWTLEQQVCNKQCKDTQTLGLRFYYAEYPDVTTWDNLETLDRDPLISKDQEDHRTLYQGLHTVVITPTYWSEKSGMNVDFDPRYFDEKCKPKNIQSVFTDLGVMFDTTVNSLVSLNAGQPAFVLTPDVKSSAKNRGSLIPPPPPSGTGNIRAGELNGAVIFDMMENTSRPY